MKLKSYLIISHLLVLLTPIITIVTLYQFTNEYNRRTEVKDYLAASIEFFMYQQLLSDPNIYTGDTCGVDFEVFETNPNVEVILYDNKGRTIYSSIPNYSYMLSIDELYKGLNEVKHAYRADVLKKPVFNEGRIVGFYEISIARENVQVAVRRNFILGMSCFAAINVIIFLFVIRRVNTRFNKPIKNVIMSMNQYAKGDEKVHIYYRAADEIGELCDHFNSMKDEIEESKHKVIEDQKAKEYMIASISHDLKTPLTAIRAYTEMFKLGNIMDQEKYEASLDIILSKCDYMKDMLDDLLTYNLLTMEYDLGLVEVEGEEFCEMLFSGIEGMCEQKQLILEQDIEVEGNYMVNVKYMTRVIDNIVSNAIRHTKDGGHIWMGAFTKTVNLPAWVDSVCQDEFNKYSEPGLWLLVKNEGNPVQEVERENLFKPFYQGDEARSKKEHKGVGLGLSISKMIIEKHRGMITVVPVESVGNIMICYLPHIGNQEEAKRNVKKRT